MRPGEIVVDRASRRFLVRPQPVRTLKEALLSRNGAKATEVWALRDVSMRIEPGEASIGFVAPISVRGELEFPPGALAGTSVEGAFAATLPSRIIGVI